MNRRSVVFFLVLFVITMAVLAAVAAVPVETGFRFGPGQAPTQPLFQGAPGRILVAPPAGLGRQGLGLRPFGLEREGIAGIWWHLGSLVAFFVLAAIALLLIPRRVDVLAEVLSEDWGQRLLAAVIGLLGYLGAGLLAFLLFINVVGAPLVLVLGITVYVATGIGLAAVSLALGRALCHLFRLGPHGPIFNLAVGVILLFILTIIPFVGWLVAAIAALLGFGAFLWTRGGDTSGWSLNDLVE